jgi:hypothetical protein
MTCTIGKQSSNCKLVAFFILAGMERRNYFGRRRV